MYPVTFTDGGNMEYDTVLSGKGIKLSHMMIAAINKSSSRENLKGNIKML